MYETVRGYLELSKTFGKKMVPVQICLKAIMNVILCAFHRDTGALMKPSFVVLHVNDRLLLTVIRISEIKFWPLKSCLRAILDVISFAYCLEMDALI